MEDPWRRRVVFDSSYFMLPEVTGDSEADRNIDPTDEDEEADRVSTAADDAESSTNDPLGYYGKEEAKEVVCSCNEIINDLPAGDKRAVFGGGRRVGCCEDGDDEAIICKKRAADHHQYRHKPCRMMDLVRNRTTSSYSSEVVNSYPNKQQNGCTAKRKKVMTEKERNRLFWDTCLAL